MKKVIFNADDFGLSVNTDLGIIKSAKNGVVRSVSLMITSPRAKEANQLAVANGISVGLHLNVTTLDCFLTKDRNGLFGKNGKIKRALSGRESLNNKDLDQVIDEFQAQLDLFNRQFGFLPAHINHHHPLYNIPGFTDKFKRWITSKRLPIRWFRDFGQTKLKHPDYTVFDFYEKENLSIEKLISFIDRYPDGIVEVMTHPGLLDSNLESNYIKERQKQVRVLTDPKLMEDLRKRNIEVIDFSVFIND